jgi:hypothetical protein
MEEVRKHKERQEEREKEAMEAKLREITRKAHTIDTRVHRIRE